MDAAKPTPLNRVLIGPAMHLVSRLPIPHRLLLPILLRDNAREASRGWERLRDAAERPRYAAVARAYERFAPTAPVLDVGCAQGMLLEHIDCPSYTGLDLHEDAFGDRRTGEPAHAEFIAGDALDYHTDDRFGAVVFNESLYYFANPIAVARSFAERTLADDGVLIVSLYRNAWALRRVERQLVRTFELLDRTSATAPSGPHTWTILVLKRRETR